MTELERDLADLEATDPAVRAASERVDETVASIVRRSRDAESTSAALRRVEQERDEALAEARRLFHLAAKALNDRGLAEAELASALTELDAVRTARDNLERARSWVVARDDGYTCDWCGQGIRRGEAYEHTHGVDEYRHVHCPTEPEEPTT